MEDFLVNLPDFGNADLRLFAASLNASSNGVVIADLSQPDEPIIYCNKAFELLTGYSKKEIIGHNCRFLQRGDLNQESRTTLRKAIKSGSHGQVLIRNYRKDGRLFWNELMISPVKNDQGIVSHYIGIQNDVTRRIDAENEINEDRMLLAEKVYQKTQTLKESESFLSSIVETTRECLLVLDADLVIKSANQSFCDFFNIAYSKIIGRRIYTIGNCQWNIPELKELLVNILPNNNSFQNFETTAEFDSIGRKMLIVNAKQMSLEGNYQDRILFAVEDITDRKAYEQRKEDFINIASHEMKTPLTAIKGNLQLLDKIAKKRNDHVYIKGFDIAIRSIERLERLVHDLLDVGRLESGKIAFNFLNFEFDQLIAESVDIIQQQFPEHHILVSGQTDYTVRGDFGRLEQVLINLLSNAIKYSPNSREIQVHSAIIPGYLKVSVTDSGIGIHERNHKKIFERFYRADNTTEKFSGMGIGLYVCNEIINEHQGNLWVESAEHNGSVFSFTIPLT